MGISAFTQITNQGTITDIQIQTVDGKVKLCVTIDVSGITPPPDGIIHGSVNILACCIFEHFGPTKGQMRSSLSAALSSFQRAIENVQKAYDTKTDHGSKFEGKNIDIANKVDLDDFANFAKCLCDELASQKPTTVTDLNCIIDKCFRDEVQKKLDKDWEKFKDE